MNRTLLSCLGLGFAVGSAGAAVGFLGAPVSAVGLAGAAVLSGVAGNSAHDLCKFLSAETANRFLDGRSAVDENHVVAKQLRLSQLKALAVTLDRFNASLAAEDDRVNAATWTAFDDRMRRFFHHEYDLAERAAFAQAKDNLVAEQEMRNAIISALPATLDESLAARRYSTEEPARRAALLESAVQLRRALERGVLAELKQRTAFADLPALFLGAFHGEGQPDAWFDLFVRDAAARLRQDGEFYRIWAAEEAALIRAVTEAHTAVLARIDRRTEDIASSLAELLAVARSGGAFQRAAAEGISDAAVRKIVERLGGEGLAAADLVPWLDNWIEAARHVLGRLTNEDESFEVARRQAERLFREGRGGASISLMQELAREEERETERRSESRRRQIRLLEEAIRLDELQLDAGAAVSKLRLVAACEDVGVGALGHWLFDQAQKFAVRGDLAGSNAALLVAIAAYRAVLWEWPRNSVPLLWATAQQNLGVVLAMLGERERGTTSLKESIVAYQSALQEFNREREPLRWAAAQDNLGGSLMELGKRESGTDLLEQAVLAHQAALEERTRDRAPLDWALSQINLGVAQKALGDRAGVGTHFAQAVASYRGALEELTRECAPLDWGRAQNNLGAALRSLAEHESGPALLEEAVGAYRAALLVRTRDRVPLNWARTQNNLANALQGLAKRSGDVALFKEAIQIYWAVLEEWSRERVPMDWAMAQNNLANAFKALGEREDDPNLLRQAVETYRAALEERKRDRSPLDWAMTQNNLGGALVALGKKIRSISLLREGIAAHRLALEERVRGRVPLDWAMSQKDLGEALHSLDTLEEDTAVLEEAVLACSFALQIYSIELFPKQQTELTSLRLACRSRIEERRCRTGGR